MPLPLAPTATLFVEPGNGSRYQLYAVRLPGLHGRADQLLYSFGLGDYPMSTYGATWGIEPSDLGYFAQKWDSPGAAGNLVDLWAGLLFLRHIFGYPTAFEELPRHLQHEAMLYTAADRGADGQIAQFPYLHTEEARWHPHWRMQLAPLLVIHRAM